MQRWAGQALPSTPVFMNTAMSDMTLSLALWSAMRLFVAVSLTRDRILSHWLCLLNMQSVPTNAHKLAANITTFDCGTLGPEDATM